MDPESQINADPTTSLIFPCSEMCNFSSLFYFRILGDLCDSIRLLKCTKCCAHKCKFIFFCIMDVDPDLTVSGRDADPDLQFFSM